MTLAAVPQINHRTGATTRVLVALARDRFGRSPDLDRVRLSGHARIYFQIWRSATDRQARLICSHRPWSFSYAFPPNASMYLPGLPASLHVQRAIEASAFISAATSAAIFARM